MAVFSFRYDADLVPDLIDNIRPFVDGWISFDDRQSESLMSCEVVRRWALIQAARDAGARWVLAVDPDERFEINASEEIPKLTETQEPVVWSFPLKELFSRDSYRVDDVWGRKKQARLFPLLEDQRPETKAFHGQWAPPGPKYQWRDTDINLYHLKMIDPARRRKRRDLYKALDPDNRLQSIGYDYLADDSEAVFETIATGRHYEPPHVERGQAWMPDPDSITDPSEIDPDVQFWLARQLLHHGDLSAAAHAASQAMAVRPNTAKFARLLIFVSLRIGAFAEAAQVAQFLTSAFPKNQQLARIAMTTMIQEKLERLHPTSPEQGNFDWSGFRNRISAISPGASDTIDTPWFAQDVTVRREKNATGFRPTEMTVVVIGVGAPPSLQAAVQSLLNQSSPCEIVVVNSGGGNPAQVLSDHIENITLVETPAKGFAGAARNLGIAASRSEYIAFLAADCTVDNNWVRARLEVHKQGSQAVAAAVTSQPGVGSAARARDLLIYFHRHPSTPRAKAHRYSLSYHRALFDKFGGFDASLRIGEDTAFNKALKLAGIELAWQPEAVLFHAPPSGRISVLGEMLVRGIRSGRFAPFPDTDPGLRSQLQRRTRSYFTHIQDVNRFLDDQFAPSQVRSMRRWVFLLSPAQVAGIWIGLVQRWWAMRTAKVALARLEAGHPRKARRFASKLMRNGWGHDLLTPNMQKHLGVPADGHAHRSLNATVYCERAQQALAKGEFQEALAAAERASALNPKYSDWLALGILWTRCGRPDRAIAGYRQAALFAPVGKIPKLIRRLKNLGATSDAVKVWRQAVRLAPGNPLLFDLIEDLNLNSREPQ